ncbi:uncharacterized protein LOC144286683 isoform X7 [Canis aureus]
MALALRCACALALVCLALLLLLRPRGALGEALQPQQPPGPRAADWLSNFAHFNKYLEKLFNSRKLPTPQEPHQQTPRNPYQRMLRNPPDRPPGNPNLRPPPRAPGPSQPVTPAMSRAEMAGAHRGPVPEKLDVRMALS